MTSSPLTPTRAPRTPARLTVPPERDPARVTDQHYARGMAVAAAYADADRLDPTRPSLGALVAQAVANAERDGAEAAGRRAGDRAYSDLLDRIAGVVEQRTRLADERDAVAERRHLDGQPGPALAERRWADALRDQANALRSVLTPAEGAEVGRRVEALRAKRAGS